MPKVNDLYYWQIETEDGSVYSQWSKEGKECTWREVRHLDKVVRASLLPKISTLPRHDCFFDYKNGNKFVRRFGRGFMKMSEGFELRRYINCIVTEQYRLWVFPNGNAVVTPPNQEIRL